MKNRRRSLLLGSSLSAVQVALAGVVFSGALLLDPASALACGTTISSDTTISDPSTYCVIWTGGSISITGAGSLTGSFTGVYNTGNSVGNLTNSGTIGGLYGILSSGSIGTITNNGTINANIGIDNGGGTITSLINSGAIISNGTAISNYNTSIGSLTNSGIIEGRKAIVSGGTIQSALSNSGTIEGMINVAQSLTITGGSLSGLGTLTGYSTTIGTITTNTNDLKFDANAYQLLDDDINVGASNTVFNNGLVRVNTTHNITGNYSQSAGGTLVVGVTDASHYGQLIVSGAATMTGSNILVAPTSGALTAGETFTIVQASTSGTNYSGVVATANGFAVTTSSISTGGFEDLILSLSLPPVMTGGGNTNTNASTTYTHTGLQAGSNGASVGAVLDRLENSIANGGDASFAPVLTALNTIGIQQGSGAEGRAIKQLAPSQVAPQVSSSMVLVDQGATVIAQHQQNFLSQTGDIAAGRSAGSEYRSGIFWGQISGGFANATEANSAGGYGQNSYGLTAGTDFQVDRTTSLGVALAWLHSNAWGTGDLSGSDLLTSSVQLTGYGSKRFGPAFVDGMFGLGYNRFDQNRAISFLGTSASASYGGMQYMSRAEAGWDIPLPVRITFTPVAGFQATHMDNNAYTESGAGAADLSVSRQIINSYATTFGFRAATTVATDLGQLQPRIRLGWIHDLTSSAVSTDGSLDGVSFATSTPRIAADGAQTGLDVSLQTTDDFTLSASYNVDARQGFLSNDGLLKASLKF